MKTFWVQNRQYLHKKVQIITNYAKKNEVGAIGKLKNQGEKKIGISKQNKTKELK